MEEPANIPPETEAVLQQLAALRHDWNSYGAAPIAPESITRARDVTREAMGMGMPAPGISPATGGAVCLEWDTEHGALIIDIEPGDGTTWLLTDRTTGDTAGEERTGVDVSQAIRLFTRLQGRKQEQTATCRQRSSASSTTPTSRD